MIALFLVLAALYFHRFWTIQDEGQPQTQASNFYRNVGEQLLPERRAARRFARAVGVLRRGG
jgi:hypothetical protein